MTHNRWQSGHALRHFFTFQLTSISKKVPALSIGLFSFFLFFSFSIGFTFSFSRVVRAKANGGANCGKGRDHPRLLFLRNKIRAVGAWGQAVPFILRISAEFGRGTTTIEPHSLFRSSLSFSFSSSSSISFLVFLLIRTPCIAFINHSWHACVYNGVLCTYMSIIIIWTREHRGACIAWPAAWQTQFSTNHYRLYILHPTEIKEESNVYISHGETIYVYIYICIWMPKATREFAESRNRDECSGDRLPVARVT